MDPSCHETQMKEEDGARPVICGRRLVILRNMASEELLCGSVLEMYLILNKFECSSMIYMAPKHQSDTFKRNIWRVLDAELDRSRDIRFKSTSVELWGLLLVRVKASFLKGTWPFMCLQCYCFHSQHNRACPPVGTLPRAGDGPGQGWTKFMAHTHICLLVSHHHM